MNLLSCVRLPLIKSVKFIICYWNCVKSKIACHASSIISSLWHMFSRIYVFTSLRRFTTFLNVCGVVVVRLDNEGDHTTSGVINKGTRFAMSYTSFNFLFIIWFFVSTLVALWVISSLVDFCNTMSPTVSTPNRLISAYYW